MGKFVISKSGIKVYKDYRDNVMIDKDNPILRKKAEYPREKYTKGAVKGLSRFGSESSEDIKSWNLFRTLQLNNQINKYYEAIGLKDSPHNIPTCPYYKKAKAYLQEKGIEYADIDVSRNEAVQKEMIEKSGTMSVPVIDIEGIVITGFDEDRINEALGL